MHTFGIELAPSVVVPAATSVLLCEKSYSIATQDPQSEQNVLVDTLVLPSPIFGLQLEVMPVQDSADFVMPIHGANGAPEAC